MSGCHLVLMGRGRAGKVGPQPEWALTVTAFLVCNPVEATVVVFTDPSGFFGANAKR